MRNYLSEVFEAAVVFQGNLDTMKFTHSSHKCIDADGDDSYKLGGNNKHFKLQLIYVSETFTH